MAWDHVEQRPHHLVRRLAASRRVLWLNPGLLQEIPRHLAEPVKAVRAGRAYFKTDRGRVRLLWTPPDLPGVRVLSTYVPLPFGGRYPLAHAVNARVVAAQVKAALAAFPLRNPVVVAEHPKALALADALRLGPLVYDAIDDSAAFEGWHDPHVMEAYERAIVREAAVLTASADGLVARAKAWGRDAHLLPNGVDLTRFPVDAKPVEIARPAGARIFGFVGAIYDWVDLDLVRALAEQRPQDRVVLVGPVRASLAGTLSALEALPNVQFVGPVPHTEVARWVAAFDVCLLPFRRNRLTESVNPVKLYEYFALGKPVLGTPIPEVSRYGELVAAASEPGELAAAISQIDEERANPALADARAEARRTVAAEHSWDGIARRLAAVVDALPDGAQR